MRIRTGRQSACARDGAWSVVPLVRVRCVSPRMFASPFPPRDVGVKSFATHSALQTACCRGPDNWHDCGHINGCPADLRACGRRHPLLRSIDVDGNKNISASRTDGRFVQCIRRDNLSTTVRLSAELSQSCVNKLEVLVSRALCDTDQWHFLV